MSNRDIVLEFLEQDPLKWYCDDCLSSQLEIKPRQQIFQICNRLDKENKIRREQGECSLCEKNKKVSSLGPGRKDIYPFSRSVRIEESRAIYESHLKIASSDFDIERVRTEIVRICLSLWRSEIKEIPPRSISQLINSLKEKDILPRHQANMMLTLCGLRNIFVYDQINLGKRELLVAQNAWNIISDWWESRKN